MAAMGKVTFPGSLGVDLSARLDRPAAEPRAYALFAHCFTCSKDIFASARISAALAARGIAVLRFDFTGLGASEGEFANTNFSSNVGDLVAAADWLRAHHAAPKLLIGHSLGGAAVLSAAARIPEAVAVATIGAPADPSHLGRIIGASAEDIERDGQADVTIAGRSFTVTRQFLRDISSRNLKTAIRDLKRALMVFHSPRDDVVGIDNASEIFLAARHPKSFVSLDDADHLLTGRADAAYVADVVAAWAGRYLGPAETGVPTGDRAVVVTETGTSRFAQRIEAGEHVLYADEPKGAGGDDTGPSPYDYLSAALGACTNMTLRLYAEHKGLPLERVRVRIAHDKVHAVDCEECETREGRIDVLTREIALEGPLSGDQKKRLLEIADKCPVHRTLHAEVLVKTSLVD